MLSGSRYQLPALKFIVTGNGIGGLGSSQQSKAHEIFDQSAPPLKPSRGVALVCWRRTSCTMSGYDEHHVTTGDIEIMGEIVGCTIVFGGIGAEPLLGATALESAGIEVDPRNQKLKRMPMIRLRGLD